MGLLGWSLLICAVACGGEAVVDRGAGGNGGATTTSTTSSTTTSTTSSTTSSTTTSTSSEPCACPLQEPSAGESCACSDDVECMFDQCAVGGYLAWWACAGGAWTPITQSTCTAPVCPNGVPCYNGEVCLTTSWGFEAEFSCVPNPCAPGPLTCDCATLAMTAANVSRPGETPRARGSRPLSAAAARLRASVRWEHRKR